MHTPGSSPLCVLLIALLSTGCVTNPARRLTPNNETYFVEENGLRRGEEKLDEEEFYTLIGDEESAKTVHESRSHGEFLQKLGATLLGVGVAGVVAGVGTYLAGSQGLIPISEDLSAVPLYGAAVMGAVVGGGYTMWQQGKSRALGQPPMYDMAHAQAALEKSLYGGSGVTPESVKELVLDTVSGQARFCSVRGTTLTGLVANDAQGRAIKLGERQDWFTWSTNPSGLLVEVPGTEARQREWLVRSPLAGSLTNFGQDLVVTVAVKDTGTTKSLVLKQDLGCTGETIAFKGADGASGSSGRLGSVATRGGASGGAGGDGGPGGDGEDGLEVDVEAAWVTAPNHERLLLVVSASRDKPEDVRIALVDATKSGPVIIKANGGVGGHGGAGGNGGSGGGFNGSDCRQGGDGGAGGQGGGGGRGGDGGKVALRVTDKRILDLLDVDVAGGPAGMGGEGGQGGRGGSSSRCKGSISLQSSPGPRGPSGPSGTRGRMGSSQHSVVPGTTLKLIRQVLATTPSLTLAAESRSRYSGRRR